ncbi:MAG TPA: acylphosphatase [Bacteroidota bacterium]
MDVCAHMVVKGLVQGVGFRYFAYRQAVHLGLRGYARNLFDGSVEIEVEGERSVVEEFFSQVKVGPRSAQVTDVKIEWKDFQNRYPHFDVR